jgi:subtilisin
MDVERYVVLLEDAAVSSAPNLLWRAAGVRSAFPAELDATALAPDEASLLPALGVAIARCDPDQASALSRCGGPVRLVQAERRFRALVHADESNPGVAAAWQASAAATVAPHWSLPLADTFFATWGLQAVGALASRYSGHGVALAVLDTGLDFTHPDFAGRGVMRHSFVAGLPPDDETGHGTFCAGVACGPLQPHNAPRYGVAPDADLFVARVLDAHAGGSDADVLAGIDWAVRHGCAVISMSFGNPVAVGDSYPQLYEAVAARALAAGSLLIAPAGNQSQRPDNIAPVEHPANCPSIVVVGAVDHELCVAPFSNGGLNPDGGGVSLVAPGLGIFSAAPRPDLYQTASGTSMATPFVAGVAALFAQADPLARGAALRARLLAACLPLPDPARDIGAGLVQAPQ